MVRIGLIGTGNIAHTHVSRLRDMAEANIIALCDPSEGSRKKLKERFALDSAVEFTNHQEMLEQVELDGVVICSPHSWHYRHAADAIAAGKHVLVEKPLTCTAEAAEKLIRQAEEAGTLLHVSFQRHDMPSFQYIRSAIASGTIGNLTSIGAVLYQDWRDNQAGTWRQNAQLSGGGMLMDSGSHIIDVLLWTTGLTPDTVQAQLHQQGSPVEVDTCTTIRFREGQIGFLNIIGKAPRKFFDEKYSFIGERGGIFYDNGKISLLLDGEPSVEPELPAESGNPDRSFVEAICGKDVVAVTGEYALRVLQLTEAIYTNTGYQPLDPIDWEEKQQ